MASKSRTLKCIRGGIAIVCILLLVGSITYAIYYKIIYVDPRRSLAELPFNSMTDAAVHLKLDESKTLFDVGLLILGVLWGLIIAKPHEAQITLSDWQEILMFSSANVLLAVSFIWRNFYLEEVGYYYLVGAKTCSSAGESCIPDIFARPLEYLYTFQKVFLVLGVLVAVSTLVSAHKLKGDVS